MAEIEVQNVSYSYNGNMALSNVSFRVNNKDFIGIIGPNGGGKTTLLKLLLGMIEPAGGTIRIFGKRPARVTRELGYVPQNTNVNESFPISIMDVTLTGRLGNRRVLRFSRSDRKAAQRSLEQVDMWDKRSERIGSLSVGQRQRVFVARALTTDPKILLLDEPTASIDPAGQSRLFEILKALNEKLTILLVSHDMNLLLEYVTQVACVNRELFYHDAPHVTSEMLNETFGFSFDQICPLEELPDKRPSISGHEKEEKKRD
ncbi:metal ABC transporter ATP-binding protein [candidate division KSB1 bacterium]